MAVKQKYRGIVRTATMSAGAIGVPGAFSFGADVAAMSTIWVSMIIAISEKSGHKVNGAYAAKLASCVLAGVGAYVGGSKIAMKLLHLIPVAGTLSAIGVNSLLNGLYTYKLGHAISNLFDKGRLDLSDGAVAAATILSLVTCIPTPGEMSDVVVLIMEI